MEIYISDTVKQALSDTAKQVQVHFETQQGVHYSESDLEKALAHWLETAIEQLADDALYHCVAGDVSFAFNRRAFQTALVKLVPAYSPAEADSVAV
ncbi:MAG: hypothetical protein ACKO7W_17885 [Elainella sp.]